MLVFYFTVQGVKPKLYYLRDAMQAIQHTAIYTTGNVDMHWLVNEMQYGSLFDFTPALQALQGGFFTADTLLYFIEEEHRYDHFLINAIHNNQLSTASNGEQRMALLQYIIGKQPGYIIADNLFDSLDANAQQSISKTLQSFASNNLLLQVMARKNDCLPFIKQVYTLHEKKIVARQNIQSFFSDTSFYQQQFFANHIPPAIKKYPLQKNPLIKMQNVSVQFGERRILDNICWEINAGECWQLIGPNGSGKTTLLAMITGDCTKGYGQDLTLFGNKKGSGESVWDIKERVGYFASYMLLHFDNMHTTEQMITSGFFDSVGLYNIASQMQVQVAQQWLQLLGLYDKRNTPFRNMAPVQQRLLLLARAMVKHPPLLILDEPTTGLDDAGAALFTALVNKIAIDTNTAILYVSHRKEEGLLPQYIFQLLPGEMGSVGVQVK